MALVNYKNKRIDYINNWPNCQPFEIEEKYNEIVTKTKEINNSIFFPFQLTSNNDVDFNIVISYIIEALNQLEKYPNLSFEFLFKAFDSFSQTTHLYPNDKQLITRIIKACDDKFPNIINSNGNLETAFNQLLSHIPVRACQYLYLRIANHDNDNQPYKRLTHNKDGGSSPESTKRKEIFDAIESKYGVVNNDYPNTVRKPSLLYRYILKNDAVTIDKDYSITTSDKLHLLFSGLLYTLRNDTMHGESISITRSSKTSLGTFATVYFAFLSLYYLVQILLVDSFKNDYQNNVLDLLAENIIKNTKIYVEMFGKYIEE